MTPREPAAVDDAAVAKVAVVQIRELVAVARLDGVHARGVGERGLVEEDRLDGAEHRQVDAQTEPEREHADNHETGLGGANGWRGAWCGEDGQRGMNVRLQPPRAK